MISAAWAYYVLLYPGEFPARRTVSVATLLYPARSFPDPGSTVAMSQTMRTTFTDGSTPGASASWDSNRAGNSEIVTRPGDPDDAENAFDGYVPSIERNMYDRSSLSNGSSNYVEVHAGGRPDRSAVTCRYLQPDYSCTQWWWWGLYGQYLVEIEFGRGNEVATPLAQARRVIDLVSEHIGRVLAR